MNTSTADLPDPVEALPPKTGGSTDDLLAQLAGDEIDRLLADADVVRMDQPSAPQGKASASAVAEAAAIDDQTSRQLDTLFEELKAAEQAPPTASAKTTAPVADEADSSTSDGMAQQLKDVLRKLNAPEATAAGPSEGSLDPGEQTGVAERQVLAAEMPDAGPESGPAAVAAPKQPRVSLIVRILAVLNSPLDRCSEAVRSMVGRIAIATLVNAMLLLFYVVFFRR